MVGHFEKWPPLKPELVLDGTIGIIVPKYVLLDTKMTLLSEIEAEIFKSMYICRPFWKMAAIGARGQICNDPIAKYFS